ncbi:MAG: hypothetical protein Q8J68_12200 [Methanolobus sp.]|uniref:hypothetical protein n=1 Tax=Methanolobus sp. TaxID=1874737 RepID=UPI0027311692|nr:hypothetical protein [Methanolobus sp.]MDP2218035.1 hypothetical protein [Methanolobus sp.]
MGWFDVVAGIATGGLYTIGKAAYQAGNAVESAGDAAEEAGLAIAVIGSTIETLGEQLISTLKEAEELLTINRLTPRSEADLWDEEKSRLNALKQEKTKVENELKALGVSNPSSFSFNFWDIVSNMDLVIKQFQLLARLAAVNKEIQNIFYQEPGVLTTGIYNAKESLERFNTIEQPMIEDILASLDDNFEVSEEILREIKKLFVTTTKVSIPVTEQSESLKNKLEALMVDKQYYNKLLTRKDILTSRMADVIRVHPENVFQIEIDSIRVPKENIYESDILDSVMNIGNVIDSTINQEHIKDELINAGNIKDDITNVINIKDEASVVNVKDDMTTVVNIKDEAVAIRTVRDDSINAGTIIGKDATLETGVIREAGNIVKVDRVSGSTAGSGIRSAAGKDSLIAAVRADSAIVSAFEEGDTLTAKDASVSLRALSAAAAVATGTAASNSNTYMHSSMQPHGARISASLSTKFDGYQRNYDSMKAQKAFYARQAQKLDKKYEKLANKWVEVPGVIPGTLEELHEVLKRVRTEEQPRIDILLDNLNAEVPRTLEELHGVLQVVRTEEQPRIDALLDNLNTGVPGTLEELNAVLRTVRTEEQPRIDLLLDNLNENLTESKEAITKANETMESVQKALSLLDSGSKLNTNMIKIGATVVGGLVVLNLFVGLIVLIRMALGL